MLPEFTNCALKSTFKRQTIEGCTRTFREHHTPLLDAATTKIEVAEIALCLLSYLFSFRSLAGKPQLEKPPLKLSWDGRLLAQISPLLQFQHLTFPGIEAIWKSLKH